MSRAVKHGMKQAYVLVLTIKEEKDKIIVKGINTETGQILPELRCASKKPLEIGAINVMHVYNDCLICNDTTYLSPCERPEQRIENVLDTFEVIKDRYDKEKNELYEPKLFEYTVAFSQMAGAIDSILYNEIKPKKQDSFQIQLKNIEDGFQNLHDELNNNSANDVKIQHKFLQEKTDELKDELHKLDLTWDLQGKTSIQIWDKLEKEGISSQELLNVKPKQKSESQDKKGTKKVVQKTLLDF